MKRDKNIRQRADGLYEGRVTINGTRRSVYGKTKTETLAKLKKLKNDSITQPPLNKTDTLKDLMTSWMQNVKKNSAIRPATYARADSTFRAHILTSELSKRRIDTIQPHEIQKLLNAKKEASYGYSSIKKIYDLLSEFFTYQVATDTLKRNPMTLVEMPNMQPKSRNIDYLTTEQVKQIQAVAMAKDEYCAPLYRYGAAIVLLLHTGLRNGELRALSIDSINLKEKTLTVKQTAARGSKNTKSHTLQEPKTAAARREIPLDAAAIEAVKVLLKTTSDRKSGLLITSEKGNILSHALLQRAFDRILKKANIEHKGLHITRHTFGTHMAKLAESEGKIKELTEILGHTRAAITYDYYIGTSSENKAGLVEKLDEIF